MIKIALRPSASIIRFAAFGFLTLGLLAAIPGSGLVFGSGSQTGPQTPATAESHIRALLEDQLKAWNAGNLEKFMEGYWRSPQLTFFSAGRRLEGWDATIDRYRKTYQSEGKEMGKTTFSELDVQVLGPDGAVVRGRWRLVQSDGKELGGLFTLVFRKFQGGPYGGWKIVHDHTSSNQ